MKDNWRLYTLSACVCVLGWWLPLPADAAVYINEVAWMGTDTSANDEWIELYNDGPDNVVLDGWHLRDGMNLDIALGGTITMGTYAVLERTDDNSAPGSAFLIYSGALGNSGATLTLSRADDTMEDQVAGGTNWEIIGGDNTTKETAQYTQGGWITAPATPGAPNVQTASQVTTTNTQTSVASDTQATVKVPLKIVTEPVSRGLHIAINAPSQVTVQSDVSFSVTMTGPVQFVQDSLDNEWNFGDLGIAQGKEVHHRFMYPGDYTITLMSEYKDVKASTRAYITVVPATFSLTHNEAGDVQVHNDAAYEVDVSNYILSSGQTVVFPARTILQPHATITIGRNQIGYYPGSVVILRNAIGTQVASLGVDTPLVAVAKNIVPFLSKQTSTQATLTSRTSTTAAGIRTSSSSNPFAFTTSSRATSTIMSAVRTATATTDTYMKPVTPSVAKPGSAQGAALVGANTLIPTDVWPIVALVTIIGLGLFGIVATRTRP